MVLKLFACSEIMPIGGNLIAHVSTTRLALSKGKNAVSKSLRIAGRRVYKVISFPYLAETEARFRKSAQGVTDINC
ncbi:hypothetical protein GIB67_021913 [Kingdonia uniflora]|uniref:Rad51-like C-terminal domain-containing protein n=1 Tax=Kingdonia uniflora TaxID=39325 RepID=A0A7J7N4N3_9MAGN|nr:hypothetical protein GIB67_021913 [Kingdonia uniflora]